MLIEIKSPEELCERELLIINEARKKEFNSKKPTVPQNEFGSGNKYFLVKDDGGDVLAFGILRPTKIEFKKEDYLVMEFVSLVAIIKRKGYGSMVLDAMKKYSKEQGKDLIGFCVDELVLFYLKNGFKTVTDNVERFAFKRDEISFAGETPGVPFFIGNGNGLINKMEEYPEEIALITRHK